jgi:hypothetical protein
MLSNKLEVQPEIFVSILYIRKDNSEDENLVKE